MNIDEIKKELTRNAKEAYADYTNYPENGEYPQGYASGCEYAIELLENLQEKKVVIPKFVADWIEEAKLYSGNEVDPLVIIYWMGDYIGSKEPHCEWLKNIYNQKLLLNAIANGYEVEEDVKKEKMYRFNIPTAYKRLYDTGKEVAILPYVYDGAKSAMTMKRAKTWTYFNAYNNAGLLEFEEVENG